MSRTALFERLARFRSAVVVTPNRRLARSLAQAFDAWQLAQGRKLWETANVLPFPAFVARLHEQAQHDPALAGVRAPLGAAQERAVWEAVVRASGLTLASPGRAAELAAEAWTLAQQWQIAARLKSVALTEDAQTFAAWADDYERRVEVMGATDQARLPDLVTALVGDGRLAAPETVVLAGFDELTPQQQALFDALTAQGVNIDRLTEDRPRGNCRRLAARDGRDELERMADWAVARLAAHPEARIGIVIPDLGARRRAVGRALDAALEPAALLSRPDRPRPYTISLGGLLADAPLVATALRALRLAADAMDAEEASALLRSPHVNLGALAPRARFDLEWRERTGRRTTLDQLVAAVRRPRSEDVAALRAGLEALQAWRQRAGAREHLFSDWAALLLEALRALGFPGPASPDSAEYQTLARWRELLTEFASLDRVSGPVDLRAAVARLARLASSTVFQPEGGDPPIQVLGLLEANGLHFDHLWIAGLTSDGWPLPARAHPFLSLELQRAKGMPGALVDLELQRARAALDRLAHSAPEVIASHATVDGDRKLSATPMIADWAEAESPPRAQRAKDIFRAVPLDTVIDGRAPALAAAEVVGGGTSTLTDQAACPFRAFARHRLLAQEPPAPHDGLAPTERGELVHRVLAAFWEALPERTRRFVAAMPEPDRRAAIERATGKAIDRLRERRVDGPGDGLLALEKRRLVNLVAGWLQFEIDQRTDFEVHWTEERRTLAIGPLSLHGRLDRVDRLPDGRSIVIDYKTGGASSVRAWMGPRPDEPQLPLYLVAGETGASAVAFARVRAGERRFVSLAEDPALLPGASVAWQGEFASWTALVAAWRTELTRLADAFAAGEAEVDPKRAATCRYCEVALLCRLNERVGDRADDEFLPGDRDE